MVTLTPEELQFWIHFTLDEIEENVGPALLWLQHNQIPYQEYYPFTRIAHSLQWPPPPRPALFTIPWKSVEEYRQRKEELQAHPFNSCQFVPPPNWKPYERQNSGASDREFGD